MNFCPQCGQPLTGTPFCPNCGAPTAPPETPPAPAAPPTPPAAEPDATVVMPAVPSQGPSTLGMPVVAPPPRRRTGLIVGLVVAALVLLGGGVAAAIAIAGGDDDDPGTTGDGGSSDTWPENASLSDFCTAMQDVDDAFDEDGMTWQDVQDSFDDLAAVGTPDDLPADLRRVLIDFADLAADSEDGDAFEESLTDEMNDDAEGIDDYLDENCPDEDEDDEQVQVPDLVGMTESAAVAVLEGTGLELETLEATSADVPEGRVISMSPSPGTLVDPGSLVSVTISTGAEQVVVPEVAGLAEADALAVLADAGFATESIPTSSDTVPTGTVIGTIPDGGSSVEPGALVSLQLSTGPEVAPTE